MGEREVVRAVETLEATFNASENRLRTWAGTRQHLGEDAQVPADETSALLALRSASVSLAAIEASRLDGWTRRDAGTQEFSLRNLLRWNWGAFGR
jgi:hypothetical protein